MDYESGAELMMNGVKGFHGKFKKMYGQIALRLDEETYLVSGDNKLLAGITEDDFQVCDINTGYLGKLFTNLPDKNCFIFGCSHDIVSVSRELEFLQPSLDDLAKIVGARLEVVAEAEPGLLTKVLRNTSVCLIKDAGVIAGASNVKKAVAAVQIVAKSCEAYVHGKLIGGAKPIDKDMASSLCDYFASTYVTTNQDEFVDFVGFDEDGFAIRTALIECGKDMVKKDLVYGSWGSASVKTSDESMLITPSSIDYFDIKIEDIVDVKIDTLEYGKQRVPSSDAYIHAIMYKNIPECNAILHTFSNALSVFSACEAGFSMSNPELKNVIGDVKVVPFSGFNIEELGFNVVQTMMDTHGAILAHHGSIFYGPSLEIVLQMAESVELMARNILGFDKREDTEE